MLPLRRMKISERKFGHGAGCWFELTGAPVIPRQPVVPAQPQRSPLPLSRASHLIALVEWELTCLTAPAQPLVPKLSIIGTCRHFAASRFGKRAGNRMEIMNRLKVTKSHNQVGLWEGGLT